MNQQPVYIDPSAKHQRLSLIDELTKLPSRPAQVPAEDQMTAALAWLADHSEQLARALCELFLEDDDDEAREAVGRSAAVGADVQLRLPSVGAGFLWADLSVAGADREFQLLVEVKLGSDFHQYAIPELGRTLAQPDAYLHAWRSCDDAHEAKVRRLGTLTLDGKAPRGDDPWRARDVTWADVHQLLEDLAGDLSPSVRLVAQDLRDHLAGRVLPPVVAPGFLERGGKLARGCASGCGPESPTAGSAGTSRRMSASATRADTFTSLVRSRRTRSCGLWSPPPAAITTSPVLPRASRWRACTKTRSRPPRKRG